MPDAARAVADAPAASLGPAERDRCGVRRIAAAWDPLFDPFRVPMLRQLGQDSGDRSRMSHVQ
jgi:hypothetical protein